MATVFIQKENAVYLKEGMKDNLYWNKGRKEQMSEQWAKMSSGGKIEEQDWGHRRTEQLYDAKENPNSLENLLIDPIEECWESNKEYLSTRSLHRVKLI